MATQTYAVVITLSLMRLTVTVAIALAVLLVIVFLLVQLVRHPHWGLSILDLALIAVHPDQQ